jgi:hypothetical protein
MAFHAKAALAAPNATLISLARFHERVAAMKAGRGDVLFAVGRFRAAAKTDAHYAVALIRVSVADRTGGEIRCVMGDQRGLAIRFAMGDPYFGLALASNAVNHQPHAMGCYGLPANDFRRSPGASGQEFSRPVDSPSNARACRCE